MNRGKFIPLFAAGLVALILPVIASAQGNYDPYSRPGSVWDDRHDRDFNRDYDRQALRNSTQQMRELSKDLIKRLDDSFNRTGYKHTGVEHRVTDVAKEFHDAAKDLDSHVDDHRDLGRSYDQARRVLQIGSHLNQIMTDNRFEPRAEDDWAQLRSDLGYVAHVYGLVPRYGPVPGSYNRPY